MNAPLDIGRLSTRIRSSEPERAQALAGQLRQVAGPANQSPSPEASCRVWLRPHCKRIR